MSRPKEFPILFAAPPRRRRWLLAAVAAIGPVCAGADPAVLHVSNLTQVQVQIAPPDADLCTFTYSRADGAPFVAPVLQAAGFLGLEPGLTASIQFPEGYGPGANLAPLRILLPGEEHPSTFAFHFNPTQALGRVVRQPLGAAGTLGLRGVGSRQEAVYSLDIVVPLAADGEPAVAGPAAAAAAGDPSGRSAPALLLDDAPKGGNAVSLSAGSAQTGSGLMPVVKRPKAAPRSSQPARAIRVAHAPLAPAAAAAAAGAPGPTAPWPATPLLTAEMWNRIQDACAHLRTSKPPFLTRDGVDQRPIWEAVLWVTLTDGSVTEAARAVGKVEKSVGSCHSTWTKDTLVLTALEALHAAGQLEPLVARDDVRKARVAGQNRTGVLKKRAINTVHRDSRAKLKAFLDKLPGRQQPEPSEEKQQPGSQDRD